MGKQYVGPEPFYGNRVYGCRLQQARALRTVSRRRLALYCGVPAHEIRALERADFTRVESWLRGRLDYYLDFPPGFLGRPPSDEWPAFEDMKSTFLCRTQSWCACGKDAAPLLCDAPVVDSGTCDAPLCEDCTTKRAGADLCPGHVRRRRKATPQDELHQEGK